VTSSRIVLPASAFVAFLGALLALSCSSAAPPPKKPEGDVPSAGRFPHAMLGRVLEKAVTEDGLVDYGAVAEEKETLDAYLGEVARISPIGQPHLFPTVEDQLAYWINAHNAAALKGILILGVPRDLARKGSELDHMQFDFGGRRMSLLGVAALLRKEYPDPRPVVVMVRGRRGGPPLAREAWDPKDLEPKLEAAARAFVKNPRYVAWTQDAPVVLVTRVILNARGLWEEQPSATVAGDRLLIEAINRYRPGRERILASRVEALPYDQRLNDVSNR
jgi:hypothetical protein